jgi:hypothetical protein
MTGKRFVVRADEKHTTVRGTAQRFLISQMIERITSKIKTAPAAYAANAGMCLGPSLMNPTPTKTKTTPIKIVPRYAFSSGLIIGLNHIVPNYSAFRKRHRFGTVRGMLRLFQIARMLVRFDQLPAAAA